MSGNRGPGGSDDKMESPGAQGVQIGDYGKQYNYFQGAQKTVSGVALPARASVTGDIESPYRGLSAYEEDDAAFFRGRENASARILELLSDRLEHPGPLVVSGASGAGKSSLLRAGVLHRVQTGGLPGVEGASTWPSMVVTPAEDPLDELALAMAGAGGGDAISLRRVLEADPAKFALTVHEVASRLRAPGSPGGQSAAAVARDVPRMLIVIDQFERLFTQCSDDSERRAFIAALHAAATARYGSPKVPAALVVLVVRADFEVACAEYGELTAAVQDRYLLTSMTERQLREAITEPARIAGSSVDDELVDQVVTEGRSRRSASPAGMAETSAGLLPLLSYALDQAWRSRIAQPLTLADYERVGGMEGAIAASADRAYRELTPDQQRAAQQVFMRLITTTPDGTDTAYRATLAELTAGKSAADAADISAVLEAFAAERLLTLGVSAEVDAGQGSSDSVEVSHEALLRSWPRLREWRGEDESARVRYGQLVADARTWDDNHQAVSFLYGRARLAGLADTRRKWAANPSRFPLQARELAFLDAATAQARRGRRRWLGVAAVVTALVVAAGTGVGLARHYDSSAGEERAIALSRQLAAASLTVDATDPVTARQLALAAWSVYPTSQAISAVADDLTEQVTNGYLPADPAGSGIRGLLANSGAVTGDGVTAVAFSPDGRLLAVGGADVRLWNPVTGQPAGVPLGAPGTGAAGLAFSPDGRLLAAADTRGDVRLWHVATRQLTGTLLEASPVPGAAQAPTEPPQVSGTSGQQVAFSADGTLVASGGSDGYARVWDVATGLPAGRPIAVDPYAATLSTIDHGVNAVAFSPARRLLATAAANGYVQLWDPATGTAVGRPMLTARSSVGGPDAHALAFSPDGKALATAGTAVGVQLWSTTSHVQLGKPLGVPPRASAGTPPAIAASCWGLAFSSDGRQLACAGSYLGPELINVATGQFTDLYPPVVPQGRVAYQVNAVAFSRVGRSGLLASGNSNGTATLWDAAAHSAVGAPLSSYLVHAATVRGIGLAYGGHLLNGPHSNGYAQLITSLAPPGVGRDAQGLSGMAFSPDGLLAAMPAGHYLQLLDARTGKARLRLPAAADRNDAVTSALFSPDGSVVASVNEQGTARLWSTETGDAIGVPLPVGVAADVGPLSGQPLMAFSPDGRLLALASMDGFVSLISTATGMPDGAPLPVDPVHRPAHASAGSGPPVAPSLSEGDRINTVAFSPNSRLMAAAGADGYIRVWDVSIRRPVGHPIPAAIGIGVGSLVFSPAGTVLASGAGDGSTRLWDPTSGTPVGLPLSMGPSTPVTVGGVLASFSPDGGLIALSNANGDTVAWPEWLVANPLQALCEQVGPPPSNVWRKYATGETEPDMCP
jgi:WD40 repeat protein